MGRNQANEFGAKMYRHATYVYTILMLDSAVCPGLLHTQRLPKISACQCKVSLKQHFLIKLVTTVHGLAKNNVTERIHYA